MVRNISLRIVTAATAVASTLLSPIAAAQTYPVKPVRLIVPWAPGGSTDLLARTVGQKFAEAWKQPVVVDNRPGASGNIGSDIVAKAPPDGYTLLVGSMSTHVMNPALFEKMPFRGVEDFAPVALMAYVRNVLFHVPYKGGGPAVIDLVGGQVNIFFTGYTNVAEHARAGRLKLLAVTEQKRAPYLPNLPTVGEILPGYEMAVYYAMFAPRGTPQEVVNRLNAEANRALALPEVSGRLTAIGAEPEAITPAQLGAILKSDLDKWTRIIREIGARAD